MRRENRLEDYQFIKINVEEFEQFALDESRSFLQTKAMAEVLENRGFTIHCFAVKSDNEIKSVALVNSISVFGGQRYELNFGPVFKRNCYDEVLNTFFMKSIQNYVKDNQGLVLEIYPNRDYKTLNVVGEILTGPHQSELDYYIDLGFNYAGERQGYEYLTSAVQWQYIKPIGGFLSEEEVFATYNSNAKRAIKKARKNELEVRKLQFEELHHVEHLITETADRQHFGKKDLSYYELLYNSFGEAIEFWGVFKDEALGAVGIFIQSHTEYTFLSGGSNVHLTKLGASFLLQHTAILSALERKCSLYNFYGVSGQFDGEDRVLQFKKNFNGYVLSKVGKFTYLPQPVKFRALQFLKKVLHRA